MTPLNISEAKSPALKRPWLDKNKLSPIFQAYAVDLVIQGKLAVLKVS